jgi:hypothetical protein
MTSPGLSPAFSAGEPSMGATMTSRQSGPKVEQSTVAPLPSTVPISAPIPSNWPSIPWSVARKSSGERYVEYGSPMAPTMPRMAPSRRVF